MLSHYYGREAGLELREDIDTVLEPGMVVSMEPMIMVPEGQPGAGGYREHDILVVGEDGAENITKFPFGPEHNILGRLTVPHPEEAAPRPRGAAFRPLYGMMVATMSPEEPREPNGNGDIKGASVIVNAIAVLRTFSADEPFLGVTEIANRVGLHKSTVSRILATFEQEELVERDPETRQFRLGLGLIAVAGPLLAELEVRRVAYPVLRELTEQTGETSALMVWNGGQAMCVEQIASQHQIRHTTPLGARYQDAMSASVQVFLSAEPAERVRSLLRSGTIKYPGLDEASLDGYQIKLHDVVGRAGPSTMVNRRSTKSAWPHPSMITAATSSPPSSSRPPSSGSPASGCKASAKRAPRPHTASPHGSADVHPKARDKAKVRNTEQQQPAAPVIAPPPPGGLRRVRPAGWPDAMPQAGPCSGGRPHIVRRSATAAGAWTDAPHEAPWRPGRCCTRTPTTWPVCRGAGNCAVHRGPEAHPVAGARRAVVDRSPGIG